MRRFPALAGLVLAIVACLPVARAQHMHHDGMDMGAMPGMDQDVPNAPAPTTTRHDTVRPKRAPAPHTHATQGPAPMTMQHEHAPGMHAPASMPMGHDMGPAQGGNPPPGARDPDYSDGVRFGPMRGIGMAMEDDPRFAMLRVDRLETFHARSGNGQQWEIEGGYGSNRDKMWLRTEGERSRGHLESADVELLWRHAVAAFWDTQLGVRADAGTGPDRQWVAFGIQGLAPYWFELEATGYVGPGGRTAARLRVDYELLFTQRLVLQPELELDAHGKADPARGLGSGLSDVSLGLRLRYEIRREFAPYAGLVWKRRFGGTSSLAGMRGEGRSGWQWVAGLRFWF